MLPKWHVIFGIIFSLILFPVLSWQVWIVLASAVLIDVDHYLIYWIKKKDMSLKNAYIFLKKLSKKQRNPNFRGKYTFLLCIFHTYEFLLLSFLLSFFNKFVSLIFIGFLFHILIDIISTRIEFSNKFFSYYLKGLSLVYHALSKDKKSFGEINTLL